MVMMRMCYNNIRYFFRRNVNIFSPLTIWFIAIVTDGGRVGAPCGVCRQVMAEFCDDDFEIIVALTPDDFKSFTLKELLPFGFSKNNIK